MLVCEKCVHENASLVSTIRIAETVFGMVSIIAWSIVVMFFSWAARVIDVVTHVVSRLNFVFCAQSGIFSFSCELLWLLLAQFLGL